jgi:hypothetical protein
MHTFISECKVTTFYLDFQIKPFKLTIICERPAFAFHGQNMKKVENSIKNLKKIAFAVQNPYYADMEK